MGRVSFYLFCTTKIQTTAVLRTLWKICCHFPERCNILLLLTCWNHELFSCKMTKSWFCLYVICIFGLNKAPFGEQCLSSKQSPVISEDWGCSPLLECWCSSNRDIKPGRCFHFLFFFQPFLGKTASTMTFLGRLSPARNAFTRGLKKSNQLLANATLRRTVDKADKHLRSSCQNRKTLFFCCRPGSAAFFARSRGDPFARHDCSSNSRPLKVWPTREANGAKDENRLMGSTCRLVSFASCLFISWLAVNHGFFVVGCRFVA